MNKKVPASAFALLLIIMISCKQKQVITEKEVIQDSISFNNHFLSLIEGKVIDRYKAEEGMGPAFIENACFADVKLLQIKRRGQNYHGQFQEGDTLRIFFNFTLENTGSLFPELNQALPGLQVNDEFKAELNEKEGAENLYSVYLYQLLK